MPQSTAVESRETFSSVPSRWACSPVEFDCESTLPLSYSAFGIPTAFGTVKNQEWFFTLLMYWIFMSHVVFDPHP